MRNIGTCRCDLLGRLLIFAMRNVRREAMNDHRFNKAGSPPCAAILTDSARSVA